MKNEIKYIYPATSLQQGFIFHSLNQPTDDAYRVQELLDYHQHLNVEIYIKAWEYCIAKYPSLRIAFDWEEDIIQLIYKYGKLDYQFHDVTHILNQHDRDIAIESIQKEDRKKGFDLSQPTLLRLHIIKQAEDVYTVLKTQHHSILDGWSGPVLFASVQQFYQQLKDNKKIVVTEDRAYLETQEYIAKNKKQVYNYWQKSLSEIESANDINSLLTTAINLSKYKNVKQVRKNTLEITGDLYKQLKAFTLKEGITINVVVQFVWNKLIQIYSSSLKTIVGTIVSGRDLPIEGIENSVGLYINTLPLVLDWNNDNSIITQLHQIQQKITELNTNSFADLTKLQKEAERIFHSVLIFENYPISEGSDDEGSVTVRDYIEKVDYPLYLMCYEYGQGLAIELNYDCNYLVEEKAQHHLLALKNIIRQVIKESDKSHHQISVLEKEEYKQIVQDWNATDVSYPKGKTANVLFEEQVTKTPDAIAIVYEGKGLSYRELNERSNQLAHYIQSNYTLKTKKSISNDTLIAICLDRSLEMVIGMLAVLKAGCAYVPMDPNYPQERVDFILEDTKAEFILTKRQFFETTSIQLPKDKVIYIDLNTELYKEGNPQNIKHSALEDYLAYVIYTSGTTGKPKGVMINHAGLCNFLLGMNTAIPLRSNDHLLAITSISFDISILELFWTLANGSTVTVKPDRTPLNNFNEFLSKHKDIPPITTIQITPSYLGALLEDENSHNFIKSLNRIIVGGEKFSNELLTKLQAVSSADVYNMYGPTETTIWSTFQKARLNEKINIGKPIQNTKIYILDSKLCPVPIGVIGELYIGGAGLAKSYLNQPKLTSERFITNPFASNEDIQNGYNRLYKTGDFVKWLPDGTIEYVGRNDEQVKIRGYRIELKEIEHALLKVKGVKQVCVLVKYKNVERKTNPYLVAYYILNNPAEIIDHTVLVSELMKVLPEYMIPSAFVAMEVFPLMVNGKLNKRALPDPETKESAYVAPVSETEKILCNIWQQQLGRDKISINDDFFRLGGDSILSILVVSRIRQAALNCKVKDIFEHRTISKLAAYLTKKNAEVIIQSEQQPLKITQNLLNQLEQKAKSSQNEIQHIYPANSLQQGFIYHALSQADDDAYRVQELIDYHEQLDITYFIKAWELCIVQYPTLRMAFNWDEELIQIIYKHGKLDYQLHDLSHLTIQEERDEAIRTIQQLDRKKGFDLSKPTLFRLHIIKQTRNFYTLIKTEHLSILDGWSGPILLSNLYSYYKQLKNNQTPFIEEQTTYLLSQEYISKNKAEAHDYWQNNLAEVESANDISAILSKPIDLSSYSHIENPGSNELEIKGDFHSQLKAFVHKEGITSNTLIQFVWQKLIHVYSNSLKSIVGTTVSGRDLPIEGIEKSVGLHINTLPLIIDWANTNTIREQLQYIQKKGIELSTFSFADLVRLQKDGKRIFHSMFIYENFPAPDPNEDDSLKTNARDYIDKVDYPLCVYVYEYHDKLIVQLTYDKDYLTEERAELHLSTMKRIILQVLKDATLPQNKLALLHPVEYNQLVQWNATDITYPHDKTFISLFENKALKHGSETALICDDKHLTYQELNEKSNQLAHHLRSSYLFRTGKPLPHDTLITICMERSLEIVVGILGVLKAGAAYVPVDPSYPQDRIDYVLRDTNSVFVLTRKDQVKGKIDLPLEKVLFIDLNEGFYNTSSKGNLNLSITPQDLAYIIYTSGSTGRPKGAMIEHSGMLNHLYAKINLLELTEKSIVSQNASQSFDISVWQFLAALLTGGKVIIYTGDLILNPSTFMQRLLQDKTDILEVVPSYLSAMLGELEKQKTTSSLNQISYLLVTGEELKSDLVKSWFSLYPSKKLVNAYGPTEASDDITHHVMNSYDGSKYIPIGKPVQNLKLYIVDQSMQLCPIGVAGEICVAGIGVGRGYLNNTSKTKEVFMDDPFASSKSIRLYKTGDIGKWLLDGNIQYLGRKDEQVKIRGYRIELGEIEHALTQIEGIKQACVLVKERKSESGVTKYLVGYYIGDKSQTSLNLQNILSEVLPEFMVPSVLVSLDNFPLTANGKLDKKALPDPDFTSNAVHVAPRSELETMLCQIWQEVLNTDKISVTDNFFRIGGDSILSIQVSSRIRQAGFSCQVKDIFECKTISKLALHLKNETLVVSIKSEQGVLSGELNLLPIQQFFVSQVKQNLFRNPDHYNQSFLIKVPVLDVERLAVIIEELVSYHDVLRIRYKKENDNWKQFYQSSISVPTLKQLDVSAYSSSEINEILTDWQSEFSLLKGELFQAGYLYGYEDGSARIYFALHHIIIDGVSWRILADDIKQLYLGKNLPVKGSSYRQWVECIKEYSVANVSENAFWLSQLSEMPNYAELSCAENCVTLMDLDKDLTKKLLQEASKAYHTEVNDLLLTALAYTLKKLNDKTIQGITLEGHGREAIDQSIDHSHTLGWFTSMFPVKLELKDSLKESIQSIKEHLRSIPNKGLGFGSFATREESTYNFNNLAPISFNYLGQFDTYEGDWQVVSENSGNSVHKSNEDRNLINMNGMVNKGKLEFIIASKLGSIVTQQFGDYFKAELISIINHCMELVNIHETYHTPSDFGFVHISQKLLDDIEQSAKKNNNEIVQLYAANSLQQGFIYHVLSQPTDDAYRVQILFDYYQALDLPNYLKSWEYCIAKYPILRTSFNWQEELIQVVHKHGKLQHHVHDISHLKNQDERNQAISLIQQEDREKAFDLSEPSLFRLHIIKQAEDMYTMLKTEHHSIADGWSGPVLLNTVHECYQQLKNNKIPALKEDIAYLSTQEYIAKNKNSTHAYWQQELSEVDSANDISSLLSKSIDTTTYSKVEELSNTSIEIKDDFYHQLKSFAIKEGITTNALLQFTWHKLLQVYSHSLTTTVGTTVSGRDLPIEEIESSVGLYINTLPLIINWNNEHSILEQLHYIQQKITEINTHSFAELAKLQKQGERLFHSLLVFENFPEPQREEEGLNYQFRDFAQKVNYPLCIQAYENQSGLTITLQHDHNYLTKDRAENHLGILKQIISQVMQDPLQSHHTISLLKADEYKEIVHDWNLIDTAFYTKDKTIITVFEEQVNKTPDAIAIVCEGKELSYRELNERSNQLARYIQAEYLYRTRRSITSDTFIALYLERSLEMVIGILGVLKAGAAYVPIDPSYPKERIDYILQDIKADLILVQNQLVITSAHTFLKDKLTYIDLTEYSYKNENSSNVISACKATDLAYVIYTSGTTGKPKGVMVEHHQVVSFALHNNFIDCDKVSVVAGVSNYAFDGSIFDLFFSLCNGKKVILIDNKALLDLAKLDEEFTTHSVDTVFITTALFNSLVQNQFKCLDNMRQLLFGGERCNIDLINKFKARYVKTSLVHVYGPTENIVYSTYCKLNDYITTNVAPIGKRLSEKKLYVLGINKTVVPIGVMGELYIGGMGVARGYLNNTELTNERFVSDPFATPRDKERGEDRLYKTGDLVRWLPDGNLEFMGRNDDQVKIRGFRIELGEIEYALMQIEGIQQASVLLKERKTETGISKYLAAYYVLNADGDAIDQQVIIQRLSQSLPEYMVPAAFVVMEALPLTANGKLNKKQFPDPDFNTSDKAYIAPANELETILCTIWKETLNLERISSTDNFFRIGGDSILSIQVSSRIRQAGYVCQVKDIFECKTISKLAERLNKKGVNITYKKETGNLTGPIELLPIQDWFLEKVDLHRFPKMNHYNQSFLIKVPPLDIKRLESITADLVSYHDVMRIRVTKEKQNDGTFKWFQNYQAEVDLPTLKILDISKYTPSEVKQILTEWQSHFDLEHGPIFQMGYLDGFTDGSARIFFSLHHLMIDGVSWRILTEDIKALYLGNKLPEKQSSYRQWSNTVRAYADKNPLEADYWRAQLIDIPAYQNENPEEPFHEEYFELSVELTKSLLHEVSKAYHTEVNDLLLTAFAYGLKEINQKDIQGITLEGHGREDIDPEIDHSRTVGWFTTMFPVRLEIKKSIKESIQSIKENLRAIPNKGIGYGSFVKTKTTNYNYNDLPLICFNYLGQFDKPDDNWQVGSEISGAYIHPINKDINLISINGMVDNGRLWFNIKTKLGVSVSKKLCEGFHAHLIKIIEHCMDKLENKESVHTPSDFKKVQISQSLLEKLQHKIKNS